MVRLYTAVLITLAVIGCPAIALASQMTLDAQSIMFPDLKSESPDRLAEYLSDSRATYRSSAIQELERRKVASAVTPLRKMLQDDVAFIRVDAAAALLAFGDKSGLPVLRAMLSAPDVTPSTALRAAKLLADNGDPTGEALANSQLSSPDFTQRWGALDVLKKSTDTEVAYAALQVGLQDEEQLVRLSATRVLGEMRTTRALEMIKPMLKAASRVERVVAVRAVGASRLWDGVPLLLDALSDTESNVRVSASYELYYMTGNKLIADSRGRWEKDKEVARRWREWWEQNKTKYPFGTKSLLERPKPKYH